MIPAFFIEGTHELWDWFREEWFSAFAIEPETAMLFLHSMCKGWDSSGLCFPGGLEACIDSNNQYE